LTIKAVEIALSAAKTADFLGTEVSVDVATNCESVKSGISFKAPDANNRMVTVPIKSVTEINASNARATRSDSPYNYRYVLDVASITGSSLEVQGVYGKNTYTASIPVSVPKFTMTVDPFANYMVMKITPEDSSKLATIMSNLTYYNGGSRIASDKLSVDAANGLVTITGLTANTKYANVKAYLGKVEYTAPAFTTEAATDVTNGDFSATTQTINIADIQVGGKYKVGAFDYYNRTTLLYSEATGWASLNQLTAYTGSSNMNTWFVVPSTYANDGQVVVRSVGYNNNGTTPSRSGSFLNTNYYCENAPSDDQLVKVAGELFLGSYSYNGNATRVDGVAFASRPLSLTFDYKYAPVNNETAEVYVKVLNEAGAVIAQNSSTLAAASVMKSYTLSLPAYAFGSKAAKIQVGFRSTASGTTPTVTIPTGSALKESGVSLNTNYYYTLSTNTYHALATGSELILDNVKLNYGAPGSSKVRRSAKK
jgi:hypothetical protein